jgi:hypothetical protein
VTDFTPYQQKIIKRYYDNQGQIKQERLAELVSELFLTQGKKLEQAWQQAAAAMQVLGIPQSRIEHLLKKRQPALMAELVQELEKRR